MTDGWVLVPRERLSRWADICTENDLIMIADEMYSALAAAHPGDGWQPIETHDGDSLPVVVGRANEKNRFYYPLSAFVDVTGVWRVLCSPGGNTPVPYEPTHFQPSPNPPITRERDDDDAGEDAMMRGASASSRDYFKTPRRGFVNLSTGKFEQYPNIRPGGGDPYRGESDEEYAARLAEHDKKAHD